MATQFVAGIDLTLRITRVKAMRLTVSPPEGRVSLSVPPGTAPSSIESFIASRREWIITHQQRMRSVRPPLEPVVDGGRARLWGTWCDLSITDAARASARRRSGGITIGCPDRNEAAARRALEGLYRRELGDRLRLMLSQWEPRVGRRAGGIRLRRMRTRWGTCNPRTRVLTFNLALAELDAALLEYVVVHELVHLWEPGHGALFRGRIAALLPDWELKRKRLKGYAG
ncbi:MAG: M48 family metallopeptidase [Arachnia sp.]